LVRAIGERYRAASREDKLRILDEFADVTGYHRKHALRLLNATPGASEVAKRSRSRRYDAAVGAALVVLWEASDRVCGKRLKALLPVLVPALERHAHLHLDDAVRAKLLSASAATIDRMLAETRAAVRDSKSARARHAGHSAQCACTHVRRLEGPGPRVHGSRSRGPQR
jgi:hypothetical protein